MSNVRMQLIVGLVVLMLGIFVAIAFYGYQAFHLPYAPDAAALGQLGDYFGGVLNPFFGLVNIVVFCWLTLTIRTSQAKSESAASREKSIDRTIALHKDYYSSNFYERVRAPAHQVSLKWKLLPEEERTKYRVEVASGWTQQDGVEKAAKYLNPAMPNRLTNEGEHFWTRLRLDGLTEHQAVSIYVRSWGRLWQLYDSGVLENDLFVALFSNLFSYEREFFAELSQQVRTDLASGKEIPGWLPAIERLASILPKPSGAGEA